MTMQSLSWYFPPQSAIDIGKINSEVWVTPSFGLDPAHAVKLRPAVAHVLQIGMECHRLVIHAERHVGRVLPEMDLPIADALLLRGEVRRLKPLIAPGLHFRVGRPAEPR